MTMARRVALIEIDAQSPGAKSYTTWNSLDKTANCTLSGGNLTATAATTTFFNAVRATLGLSAGQHYWETTHNFSSGNTPVAGVCTAAFAMATTTLGNDVAGLSATGPRNDGICFFKAAGVGDAGTMTTGALVRHWLDMDAGTYKVAIAAGAWLTVATGLTGTWHPVAQLATTTHSVTANFGATAFTYAVPKGALAGLYTIGAATSNPQRFATEPVFTLSTSTPASAYYKPRVLLGDITLRRKARPYTMAGSGADFSVGELLLANDDNALEFLRDLILRDRPVTIRYGTPTQATKPENCERWVASIVDRPEFRDRVVALKITDQRSRLNKPLQTTTYTSAFDGSVVDRTKPVTLGKAVNVEPVLYDSTNRRYDVHDDANIMVLEVTDQADADVLITDYRQYNNGFTTTVSHVGKTAATLYGESTLYADQIGADGDMTTWVAGAFTTNPQNWVVTGETSATVGVHQSPAGSAQIRNTGGGGQVLLGKTAFGAGTVTGYLVDFTVTNYVSGSLRIWSSTAANATTTQRVAGIAATGTYRVLVQPAATETFIVFGAVAGSNTDISIDAVHVYPLIAVEYLPEWLTHLCVTRAGLVSGDLDNAAITALDAAARYPLGYHAREAVNIDQVLRETMDNFCGWIVPNSDGKLTVGRLEEPSSTPVLSLTRGDLAGRPSRLLDEAKGLTTRMGAVRNWMLHSDSDFATSVPLATREKLKLAYQETCKALGSVSSTYAHAANAAVRGSLMQLRASALAEISRVATLYRQDRYIYEIPAILDITTANSLALGTTIRVTHPALDLAIGKNLQVLGVDSSYRRQRALLTCWG
jgi:hypothetical protein